MGIFSPLPKLCSKLYVCVFQNRRTRITLPENKTPDHDIHTLDLGLYAEVAMLPTDDDGLPVDGQRKLHLNKVNGDFTAWIHVGFGMNLDIDFKDTAVMSFSIAIYEVEYLLIFHRIFTLYLFRTTVSSGN